MKKRNKVATNPIMKKGGAHTKPKRKNDKIKLNSKISDDLLEEISDKLDKIDD